MTIAATTKTKWLDFVRAELPFALPSHIYLSIYPERICRNCKCDRCNWYGVNCLVCGRNSRDGRYLPFSAHAIVEFIGARPQCIAHSDSNVSMIASRRLTTRRWCEFSNANGFFYVSFALHLIRGDLQARPQRCLSAMFACSATTTIIKCAPHKLSILLIPPYFHDVSPSYPSDVRVVHAKHS